MKCDLCGGEMDVPFEVVFLKEDEPCPRNVCPECLTKMEYSTFCEICRKFHPKEPLN